MVLILTNRETNLLGPSEEFYSAQKKGETYTKKPAGIVLICTDRETEWQIFRGTVLVRRKRETSVNPLQNSSNLHKQRHVHKSLAGQF
jgi:hypothetical protein